MNFTLIHNYIFRRMMHHWHRTKELLSLIRRRVFRVKVLNSERVSISYPIVPSPDKLQCGAILLSLSYFYISFLLQWKHSNMNLLLLNQELLRLFLQTYSVIYRFFRIRKSRMKQRKKVSYGMKELITTKLSICGLWFFLSLIMYMCYLFSFIIYDKRVLAVFSWAQLATYRMWVNYSRNRITSQ